ncbi:hypothetical protein BU15DRAFT_28835, partial [Melanogaster broomeanus]
PCGFCGHDNGGRAGEDKCALSMKITSRAVNWESRCPYKHTFQYGSASKGSDSRPCRNVPVICTLCHHPGRDTDTHPAIWRYNMEAHLNETHPEYAHPGKQKGLALPRSVYEAMVLTPLEEKKAGVP